MIDVYFSGYDGNQQMNRWGRRDQQWNKRDSNKWGNHNDYNQQWNDKRDNWKNRDRDQWGNKCTLHFH